MCFLRNVQKLKSHASLQKGGANDIHDIEDLVGLGHKVRGENGNRLLCLVTLMRYASSHGYAVRGPGCNNIFHDVMFRADS